MFKIYLFVLIITHFEISSEWVIVTQNLNSKQNTHGSPDLFPLSEVALEFGVTLL